MELEDMIKQYLEQALAPKPETPAPVESPATEPVVAQKAVDAVTKGELSEILAGFAQTISEQVQKALPDGREPGTGRKGVQGVEKNAPAAEADALDAVVQKARTDLDKLEADEKELLYRLAYEYLTAGLR